MRSPNLWGNPATDNCGMSAICPLKQAEGIRWGGAKANQKQGDDEQEEQFTVSHRALSGGPESAARRDGANWNLNKQRFPCQLCAWQHLTEKR